MKRGKLEVIATDHRLINTDDIVKASEPKSLAKDHRYARPHA